MKYELPSLQTALANATVWVSTIFRANESQPRPAAQPVHTISRPHTDINTSIGSSFSTRVAGHTHTLLAQPHRRRGPPQTSQALTVGLSRDASAVKGLIRSAVSEDPVAAMSWSSPTRLRIDQYMLAMLITAFSRHASMPFAAGRDRRRKL